MHTIYCPLSESFSLNRVGQEFITLGTNILAGETKSFSDPSMMDVSGLVVRVWAVTNVNAAAGSLTLTLTQQTPNNAFGASAEAPISDTPKSAASTLFLADSPVCIQQSVSVEGFTGLRLTNGLDVTIRKAVLSIVRRPLVTTDIATTCVCGAGKRK